MNCVVNVLKCAGDAVVSDLKKSFAFEGRASRLEFWMFIVLYLVVAAVLVGSLITGWLLAHYTDDSDPYLDAFTTIPAIAGQILMVSGYREQWFFWFCIDVGCVWLWVRAGNWSMAALYAFWCANCIYGYINWKRLE